MHGCSGVSAELVQIGNCVHQKLHYNAGILKESSLIDKDLLAILSCPACKGRVEERAASVVCVKCGRKYPVRNGIPVLIVEESEK